MTMWIAAPLRRGYGAALAGRVSEGVRSPLCWEATLGKVLLGAGMMPAPLALASPSLTPHHHPPEEADIHEKF